MVAGKEPILPGKPKAGGRSIDFMKAVPKKELGQHWLKDKHSLQSMVEAAEVNPGETVLEIGPGTGYLTEELLSAQAKITALEFDHTLAKQLLFRYVDNGSVTVVEGDIRQFDFATLPDRFKIVANIPYYLTANLFRKLIDAEQKPQIASLLVQKEVAERASAVPGKLSFVAVALQFFYEVTAGELVPAHLFEPPPKIDSQILVLKKREEPLVKKAETEEFLKTVKAGFSQPRKKLISNLATEMGGDKGNLVKVFDRLGLDQNIRAQELSLANWQELFAKLKK